MGDDRPRVWDMGGDEIRSGMIDNGYGDLVRTIDAHDGIDTDAIKRTALTTYGVSRQNENPVLNPDGCTTDGELTPDLWAITNAEPPHDLEESARLMTREMYKSVQDRWSGPAYDEFESYTEELSRITRTEANRLREIGDGLWDVAQAIEDGKQSALTQVLGSVNMLRSMVGKVESVAAKANIIRLTAETTLDIFTEVNSRQEAAKKLAEKNIDAKVLLDSPSEYGSHPTLEMDPFPDEVKEWKVKP